MMAATPIDEEFRTGWRVIQRLGARVVLSGGAILLGAGAIDLSHAAEPWQLYPCNLVMGLGGNRVPQRSRQSWHIGSTSTAASRSASRRPGQASGGSPSHPYC